MHKTLLGVLVFLSTSLYSIELPDYLEKNQFVTITETNFYYDSAWGMHEWFFLITKTFSADDPDVKYNIEFGKKGVPDWKVGDYLYIDQEAHQVYNLRTKAWSQPNDIFFY